MAVFALPHPDMPVVLLQVLAAVNGAMVLLAWFGGTRWPRAVRAGGLVTLLVITGWITVVAVTGPGAISSVISLVWLVVHQAVFAPARVARTWLAASVATLVVGIAAQPAISGVVAGIVMIQLGATLVVAVEAVIRVQARVQGLTTYDRLTGAVNRLGLELAVNHAMAFSSRNGEPTALAMIDLDDFKTVNDEHGHLVGDARLRETVDNWRQALRETDVVSRYGGDEFIVLFPRTDLGTARALLHRLAEVSPVAWTAGVALVRPDEPLEDAIRRADEAMYETRARQRP